MTRRKTAKPNPVPFSDEIIVVLAHLIPLHVPAGHGVHDPFAGGGVPLGALCDRLGYVFTGVDIEPWRGADRRVALGDSTNPRTYPTEPFAVVTSPSYNNGVNDHFEPRDSSRRLTYRVAAGRALRLNNTGRWSGRGSPTAEAEYWRITDEVVKHWPDLALVNVKDSHRSTWEGGIYPLVRLWTELLEEHGYAVTSHDVAAPGWRFGENGQARSDSEAILIARRKETT